jgi:hypothetical protein
MSNIPLPTDEAQFLWHGGSTTPAGSREMAYGVDALNLHGSEIPNADISEFGQLIRSVRPTTLRTANCADIDRINQTSILYKIMALFGQGSRDRLQTSKSAAALEAELRVSVDILFGRSA